MYYHMSDHLPQEERSDLDGITRDNLRYAIGNGQSCLIHGQAGTGKTYLMREMIGKLMQLNKSVAIIAPTKVAAMTAHEEHGCTFHSFFQFEYQLHRL